MMPDRLDELKNPKRKPAPAKKPKNPYSLKAVPVPAPVPQPGQVQPDFSEVSLDPFDQAPPSTPLSLLAPAPAARGPGAQDLRTDKMSRDYARGKTLNVYQEPAEYNMHLRTVMDAPLMQELAAGADRFKGLREDFLKNAQNQTDLSSAMAFADFLSKGKGNALAGYKRPPTYEDLVGQLGSLIGEEQKSRQNIAQLAQSQAGGLKKGQEEAQVKTGVDADRAQGFRTPTPRSAFPGGNPLNQALGIQRAFQSLPPYKDAEKEISSAQLIREIAKNPNWVSDFNLRGQMLQAMKLSPISEKEMAAFGMGSPDLFNKVRNMISQASNGRTLSAQDYKALDEFASRREEYGRRKMEDIQSSFASGLSPYSPMIGQEGIMGITRPSIPQVAPPAVEQESESDRKFNKLMERFGVK
jgi:hypothetical protein